MAIKWIEDIRNIFRADNEPVQMPQNQLDTKTVSSVSGLGSPIGGADDILNPFRPVVGESVIPGAEQIAAIPTQTGIAYGPELNLQVPGQFYEPTNFAEIQPQTGAGAQATQPITRMPELGFTPNVSNIPTATLSQGEEVSLDPIGDIVKGIGIGIKEGVRSWAEDEQFYNRFKNKNILLGTEQPGGYSPLRFSGIESFDRSDFVTKIDAALQFAEQGDIDSAKYQLSEAYGIRPQDITQEGLDAVLNSRYKQIQDRISRGADISKNMPDIFKAPENSFYNTKKQEIQNSLNEDATQIVKNYNILYPNEAGRGADVANQYMFYINKNLEKELNSVNALINRAQQYREEGSVNPNVQERFDQTAERAKYVFDEYLRGTRQIGLWRAEGLSAKEIDNKIKEQGFTNINDFLWGNAKSDTGFQSEVLNYMTPTDWISYQQSLVNIDSGIDAVKQAVATFSPNRDTLSRGLSAVVDTTGLPTLFAGTVINRLDPNPLYRSDVGGLSLIDTGEDRRLSRPARRLISDVRGGLDDILPLTVSILKGVGAAGSRIPTALNIAGTNSFLNTTQKALRTAGINISDDAIKNTYLYTKFAQDKIAENIPLSLRIEGALNTIDPERTNDLNKDLSLGGLLLFDTAMPILGVAAGELFRASRLTQNKGQILDAFNVIRDTGLKFAGDAGWLKGADGSIDVQSIEQIQKTMDAGYSQIWSNFFKAQGEGEQALGKLNEQLKTEWAKRSAILKNDVALGKINEQMDLFSRGLTDRSINELNRRGVSTFGVIDPEAVRYTDQIIQEIKDRNINIADMIKVDLNIKGKVKFGPYTSSKIIPADLQDIDVLNYSYPQQYNNLLQPGNIAERRFNPMQVLDGKGMDSIYNKLSNEELNRTLPTDSIDRIKNVYNKANRDDYFDKFQYPDGRVEYRLNELGLRELDISKINPTPADVGVDAGQRNFYDALADANSKQVVYAGNINTLKESRAYERVYDIVEKFNPCS